jgi:DNA-binding winged helix-turn-helix (wHTH) protein
VAADHQVATLDARRDKFRISNVSRMSVSGIYQFGQFELHVDAAELRRDGRPIRLQPQPFTLLTLLVRRAGDVVTRQQIREELWPDGTFVDFDQAMNFAVKQVRDALGDSAESSVYIQTLPKRGYRFIAPVTPPSVSPVAAGQAAAINSSNTVRLQKAVWANIVEMRLAQRRQRRLTLAAIAIAALALVVLLGYWLAVR